MDSNIVNVEKVLSIIDRTFDDLKKNIDLDEMDEKAIAKLYEGLDKLEVQAWKCKVNAELRMMMTADSSVNLKEALLDILSKLPDTISADGISEIVNHARLKWEKYTKESVAV